MDFKVCWHCKGLSAATNVTIHMDNHIMQCPKQGTATIETSEFDYYVCEKADFFVLSEIKQCLNNQDVCFGLKNREEASWTVVPKTLIESLLKLSISSTVEAPRLTAVSSSASNSSSNIQSFHENKTYLAVKSSPSSHNESSTTVNPSSFLVTCDDKDSILNLLTDVEKAKLNKECNTVKNGNCEELICKLCSYQTKSNKIMLRHLNSHNNGQAFQCKKCNFSTMKRSSWNLHHYKQQGRDVSCNQCSERLPPKSKRNLRPTKIRSEKTKNPTPRQVHCDVCGYIGRDLVALKEHRRKHTGETLMCSHDNCKFKTQYKRSLQKHLLQKHSEEKAHMCEVCGFQTRHVASLQKHMKLHKDSKQYKCAECSYCSHSPSDVLLHVQRKHLKQKNHSCPKCPYKTAYLLAMKKHMARHERIEADEAKGKKNVRTRNLKYYSCSVCGDVLNSMNKAKEHIQKFHSSVKFQILSQKSVAKPPTEKPLSSEPVVFNEKNMSLHNLLDVDITSDVLDIANNILNSDVNGKDSYSPGNVGMSLPDQSMCEDVFDNTEDKSVSRKGGNPMLSATSDALADIDSSLIEESLFDLMSDFPRPPTLNRCQSASTLMFQSLTQHMVDRPLTPDFFTDSPAQSFFQNLSSRSMDQDNFGVNSLNQPFQMSSGFSSQIDLTAPATRTNKPPSPVLPNFTCFPPHQSASQTVLNLPQTVDAETGMSDILLEETLS